MQEGIKHISAKLEQLLGAEKVNFANPELFVYSRDSWPKAILWTRAGKTPNLPLCVVRPTSVEEVAKVLRFASEEGVTVVPFGGGSSVCGSSTPMRGGIVLDLKLLRKVISIDTESMIAEAETGIIGAHLEEKLNRHNLTLGHFPSSIMCSTLGGWLAARSAGQCSSRYGKIEDMVVGIEAVLPNGDVLTIKPPAPAGFNWQALFVGSEGTLGVITKAWLKVHKQPQTRKFVGVNFPSVQEGLEAMREVMQRGLAPAVLRLYDPIDTLINKTHTEHEKEALSELVKHSGLLDLLLDEAVGEAKLKLYNLMLKNPKWVNRITFNLPVGALLVAVFEGEEAMATAALNEAEKIFKHHKGQLLGPSPAEYWFKHRYSISFKQMDVFRAGGFVDTMEVATTWDKVHEVYSAVRSALAPLAFVMAHFSHAYEDGCAIYFTFSAAVSGNTEALQRRYDEVWTTALRAVHESGATISHHHGVGLVKSAFMISEHGSFMGVFRRLKQSLDTKGILNPGKMGL